MQQNNAAKYNWKQKEFYSSHINNLQEYFATRKQKLFQDLQPEAGVAKPLLSLLPPPGTMKDIEKAVKRTQLAMERQEKISIFGDYDVDGTTSCAMLFDFFQALNFPVDIYIPDRLTEGYGLNPIGVEKLARQGTKVIITVDNGISAVEACEKAKSLGIDVIITDHHDVPTSLPNAFAILNPKQKDCQFPFKMLAGVGVAFYYMIALRSLLRETYPTAADLNLKYFLDFVALGTIADMAPLNGVNHILCKVGLEVLTEALITARRPGLSELMKLAGWNGESSITAGDVGFKIGPRLNAAGRLGNALRSVDVLITKDFQEAKSFAQLLHAENSERQQMEKKFTQEAFLMVEKEAEKLPDALILHKEDWHSGVVGLVASRVLEKFYRPTLVFGTLNGKLKGSGRSTHSFNLFAALDAVRHEFISFGGHFHAVGLTLEPHKLPWLQNYLQQKASELIATEDKIPPLFLDGQLPLDKIDKSFVSELEFFEPYGIENPRTKWLIGPLEIRHVKRIGKDPSQGHAKILFLQGEKEYWLTAFGLADAFERLRDSGLEVELVVEAKRNFWKEREYVDLSIVDFAPLVYACR